MTSMGREYKKRVDIYLTDSLCCRAETNTTLQINSTPINFFKKQRVVCVCVCVYIYIFYSFIFKCIFIREAENHTVVSKKGAGPFLL